MRFTGATSTTMPVEPGIVDTNVLIYALDTAAPQHTAALALLNAAREDGATLYVTSQILCEFYSVVTNPRRVARPRGAAEAMTVLSEMLAFLQVLPIPVGTVEGLLDLLRRRPVIAAMCSTCTSSRPCRRTASAESTRSMSPTLRLSPNSRLSCRPLEKNPSGAGIGNEHPAPRLRSRLHVRVDRATRCDIHKFSNGPAIHRASPSQAMLRAFAI